MMAAEGSYCGRGLFDDKGYQGEIDQETLEWLGGYYETPQNSQQRNSQFALFFLQNVANIIAVWNQSRAMVKGQR